MCVVLSIYKKSYFLFLKYVENCIIFCTQGFSSVLNSILVLKRLHVNILAFVIFTHSRRWNHFHPRVMGCLSRRIECSMLQSNPAVLGHGPSSWIQYTQTVRHRYILFVFTVCLFFFRLQSELSISISLTFRSGCPWTVPFKLDTVYSDSPSSLHSFCNYGVLVFFPPAVQA